MRIAYWTNNLGEEMSSRVHAEFEQGDKQFIVVHDWREGARNHGFVVIEHDEAVLVRNETPR